MAAIILVEMDLGVRSLPCCIRDPTVNHMELHRENSFTRTSCSLQGWGLSHSYGLNLKDFGFYKSKYHVYPKFLPSKYKKKNGNDKVGKDHVNPDFKVKRRHEGKKGWFLLPWFSVENTYAKSHEGVGEIHRLFSLVCYGQVGNSKVSFLQTNKWNSKMVYY